LAGLSYTPVFSCSISAPKLQCFDRPLIHSLIISPDLSSPNPTFLGRHKIQTAIMSTSPLYRLVEPHPHATSQYIHTARGGAGNIANVSSTTNGSNASGPASSHPSPHARKRPVFTSGRGGLGNVHHTSERAIFSFDEELERDMRQTQDLAPVCYVGRGGLGNRVHVNDRPREEEVSDTDSIYSTVSKISKTSTISIVSTTSTTSTSSNAELLNNKIKKGWGWMVSHDDDMMHQRPTC
jgi:Protein of unknown function (DUF3602)